MYYVWIKYKRCGIVSFMDGIKTEDKPLLRDEKGLFVEGTAPGPGRPRGSISIKDKVRQHLEEHPEDVAEIVTHFVKANRELMWQMLEGRPPQELKGDPDRPLFLVVPPAIYEREAARKSGQDSPKQETV